MSEYRKARAEGKTSVEVEAPVKEAEEDKEEPAAKEEAEAKAKAEEKPKSKGGFQTRIDKLVKESASHQAELAEARKVLAERERKIAELESGKGKAEPEKKADAKPKMEDFKDLDEYIAAMVKYGTEQELKSREENAKKQEEAEKQQAIERAFSERQIEARTRYEDYDKVLAGSHNVPPIVFAGIIEMENGPDVAYFLAKNADICEELFDMTPIQAVREVSKIADKLAAESSDEKEETEETEAEEKPKLQSKAPAPIKPVGGATKSRVPLDQITSMKAYRDARRAGRTH